MRMAKNVSEAREKSFWAKLDSNWPVRLDNDKFLSLMESNIRSSTNELVEGIAPLKAPEPMENGDGTQTLTVMEMDSPMKKYILSAEKTVNTWLRESMEKLPDPSVMMPIIAPDCFFGTNPGAPWTDILIPIAEFDKEIILMEVEAYVSATHALMKLVRKGIEGDRLLRRLGRKLSRFENLKALQQ